MDINAVLGSLKGKIMANKKIAAVGTLTVIVIAVMLTLSMLPSPTLSGSAISKETTTTLSVTGTTMKNYCGDGICQSNENCNVCPKDCNCVQLKLSSSIEKETMLGICTGKVKVTYSAINSGNSNSNGVSLVIESIAPHLNLLRDRKTISLDNFNVGMSPVVDEVEIKYTCDDDISQVNLTLSDSMGNKAYSSHEWRKK